MEYFLHLFLSETLVLDGHTASGAQGCLHVPAVSQGTENRMESLRVSPWFCTSVLSSGAFKCSHSEAPGRKMDTEPRDRETLITKPFV